MSPRFTDCQPPPHSFFIKHRPKVALSPCRMAGFLLRALLAAWFLVAVQIRPLAAQELGMDPGMMLDNAVQTRRGNQFFLQPPAGDRSYQLVSVAEQGTLQDSRPFEIIDSSNSGKQDYQAASGNNVSPFFFEWNNSLGRLSAALEIDTVTRAYYYRNKPGLVTTPASPVLRDQARTIYREIPGNTGAPGLPQLKNSLDDFVHMAFFERDSATATEFLSGLETLSYSVSLRAGRSVLDHPFNYQQHVSGNRELKPRTGSRIVASVHWAEDRDGNGVQEVYLIEINVGGVSSNPAWQSNQRCAHDLQTHANVISGQYMVLGGEYWLNGQGLPLPAEQTRNLTINWGRILTELAEQSPGSDCKLNATLQTVPNTMGLGVAIEARGGVLQSLEIAGALAHREDSPPSITIEPQVAIDVSGDADSAVQVQFAPQLEVLQSVDQSVALDLPNETAVTREPLVEGSSIYLPSSVTNEEGFAEQTWWQILSAEDWSPRCSDINQASLGPSDDQRSCEVSPGLYSVIEHVSGVRWDNLRVLTVAENSVVDSNNGFEFDGLIFNNIERTLSWTQPGWYQVQRESDYASVCESAGFCVLEPGVYQIVNHTTGRKWHNFVVHRNQL